MKAFALVRATSVAQAATRAAQGATLKAGGLDLLDLMKEGLAAPRELVDLRGIAALGGIVEQPGGGLRIGATVTLAQLAAHPLVRNRYRAVAQATAGAASPQIRNAATIGGNLLQRPRCWYFRSREHYCARKGGPTCFAFAGENQYHAIFGQQGCAIVHPSTPATALVAFDARVELATRTGARTVALEEFFRLPAESLQRENSLRAGEILTAIVLPPAGGMQSAHLRQGELDSFDWPLADVAVVLERDGTTCRRASIVLGAAAPVPWRAKGAQSVLAGNVLGDSLTRQAADAALTGAAPLAHNAYKVPIFKTLVQRAIAAAAKAS